jgi:hypothetical protein
LPSCGILKSENIQLSFKFYLSTPRFLLLFEFVFCLGLLSLWLCIMVLWKVCGNMCARFNKFICDNALLISSWRMKQTTDLLNKHPNTQREKKYNDRISESHSASETNYKLKWNCMAAIVRWKKPQQNSSKVTQS